MDHLPEIVMLIRTLAYRVSSLCTTLIANCTQIKKKKKNFIRHKINPKSTNHFRSYSVTQKYTVLWPEGSEHDSQTSTKQPVWKEHKHVRYDRLEILLTTLHFAHDTIQLLK